MIASLANTFTQGHSILVHWHYCLRLPADLHVLLLWLSSSLQMVPEYYGNHGTSDLDVRLGRVHQMAQRSARSRHQPRHAHLQIPLPTLLRLVLSLLLRYDCSVQWLLHVSQQDKEVRLRRLYHRLCGHTCILRTVSVLEGLQGNAVGQTRRSRFSDWEGSTGFSGWALAGAKSQQLVGEDLVLYCIGWKRLFGAWLALVLIT